MMRKKMRTSFLAVTAALALSLPLAWAAVRAQSSDAAFLSKAAAAGQSEMDLADLAMRQSQNADVKGLATKIKGDHMEAASELTALANRKNIMTSTTETGEQDAVRARLSHLSGAEFDAAYLDQMVKDHQQAVADFTAAEKSSDTDVRAFAAKTLPLLRDHLRRSENLQKVTGKGK